ncbi:MAG: hypothetical protein KAH32_05715 [Chlamydiia bacterium]|nr:hypothetical protein [Chlamydiia bacterium]
MAKTKLFIIKQHAISLSLSDRWFEVVDGTNRYEYISLTHRIKHGNICIISLVLLWVKVTFFIKYK